MPAEVSRTFRTADPLGSPAEGTGKMAKEYRKYSPKFREEVAKMMVGTSQAITDVAREYGCATRHSALGPGLQEKHGSEAEAPLTLPERARLRELERENRELQMKCAFPSKAAAYFAAEHR